MGSSTVSSARSLLEPTLASNEDVTHGGWASGELTYGRPTGKPGQTASNFTGRLLGGPPFHLCGSGPVLRRVGSSSGLVDPRECI